MTQEPNGIVAEVAARRSGPFDGVLAFLDGRDCLCPSPVKLGEVDRIVMDELAPGTFKPEAMSSFRNVFQRMKGEGCDAVIFGCTEIPLIVNDSVSPIPTLDSTRLLALAALQEALREG